MNIDNITKGEVFAKEIPTSNGSFFKVGLKGIGEQICNIITRNSERAEGNANLIAEAFNTTTECGLSPSQLLQQNKELREALEWCKKEYGTLEFDDEFLEPYKSGWEKVEETLSKHPNK